MGRRRWWKEDMGSCWTPPMGCFGASIASRDVETEEVEGQRQMGFHAADDGLLQVGKVGRRKWLQCKRMVWSLTVLLFSGGEWCAAGNGVGKGGRNRRTRGVCGGGGHLENNRSWLLAETDEDREDGGKEEKVGSAAVEDPQSTHSSFRFSFGSQADADTAHLPATAAATTVLLLNLEKEEEEMMGGEEGESPSSSSAASSTSQIRDRHMLLLKYRRLESLERSISPVAAALVRFSYQEIRAATRDFCGGRVLGRGALSCVYRGRLGRGLRGRRRRAAVAIKRLEGLEKECAKAFCRELMIAGSLRNPNIVPLLGFCIDREGLFLVYKYVSGGSVDLHLHPEKNGESNDKPGGLPWGVRFKVALGTARAVEYLHHGTDKCIVHRDIKPSNILLSSNKAPKLCDFGLATWTHGPSLPFLCKTVQGTFGYLAPEYFQHGKLSDKTDVYAFGVVLLELITGRKPIDTSRPQGDENLVLWAKPLLQQGETAMQDLVDPRLRSSSYNQSEMCRMVRAAAACLNSDESGRPRITEVIGMLCGEENCNGWPAFTGNGCFAGYGPQLQDLPSKSEMKGHLALAMLGVSDTDEDDLYDR